MIIGIDGNEANVERRVGVNVYAYDILCSISKLLFDWPRKHSLIVYLNNEPLPDMPKETQYLKYRIMQGRRMWILTKLIPELLFAKTKPDIFFSPSHYLPPFPIMPKVCSIMDLGYLSFSGQFKKRDYWQLKIWSAISIYISKAVVAISDSTRRDIVRHYPSASKKVTLVYPALENDKFNIGIDVKDVRRIRNKYTIVGDYILFLGTLKPSKNIEGLIDAFSILKTQFKILDGTKLVIAGKKGWLYESIFDKVERLGLENDIVFTDYVPDEEKRALIAGAKVFCLPSYWEGFGFDVLNAMACGVPAVVSNVGSLPEVAGDAGIYIEPGDVKSIAVGLEKVLGMDKIEYTKLVEKSLKQVKKFSWKKSAEETLKVFENIYK